MLSAEQVVTMIDLCRQTFGSPAVLDGGAMLQSTILFPAETPKLHQSLEAWQQAQKMRDLTGPTLTAQYRLDLRDTTATLEQWRDIVCYVQNPKTYPLWKLSSFASPAPLPASPDYGPAGRPSPGRLVRLRLTGRDVPAMIHAVTNEATGACLLTYTDVPASVLDLPMREATYVVQRAFHAPFGREPGSGCWDYWPKV